MTKFLVSCVLLVGAVSFGGGVARCGNGGEDDPAKWPESRLSSAELCASLEALVEWCRTATAETVEFESCVRASRLVRLAGLRCDPACSAPLRAVVDASADRCTSRCALEALSSLWQIGEPVEYFESQVAQFDAKPLLASQAMFVLARSSSAERCARFDEIADICEERSMRGTMERKWSNSIQRGASEARWTFWLSERCRNLADTRSKVLLLAREALCGYAPFGALATHADVSASVFWARSELARVSAADPGAAAASLLDVTFRDCWDPRIDGATPEADQRAAWEWDLRECISQFLDPTARVAWATIRDSRVDLAAIPRPRSRL